MTTKAATASPPEEDPPRRFSLIDLYSWDEELVRIGDIQTKPEYQRATSHAWIRKTAKEFDWHKFGIVEISVRDEGSFWAMDGQHRVEVLKLLGLDDESIPVALYRNLAIKDEASIFWARNGGRSVHPFDRFKAELLAEFPEATAISRVVKAAGLRLTRERVRNGVACATALRRVYSGDVLKLKRPMPTALKETLLVLKDAWMGWEPPTGKKPITFHPSAVEGVGALVARHEGKVDLNRLIERLAAYPNGPIGFIGNARRLQEVRGGLLRNAVADQLTETYNDRLRVNRLPPWSPA